MFDDIGGGASDDTGNSERFVSGDPVSEPARANSTAMTNSNISLLQQTMLFSIIGAFFGFVILVLLFVLYKTNKPTMQ